MITLLLVIPTKEVPIAIGTVVVDESRSYEGEYGLILPNSAQLCTSLPKATQSDPSCVGMTSQGYY